MQRMKLLMGIFGQLLVILGLNIQLLFSLTLKTKYGQYVYTLDSVYPAFIEDNELVNKNTGDKVNLLDPKTERLAIYNSVTKKVFQYTLKKGTTINIE